MSGEANIQGLTAGTGNNSPLSNQNTAFGYQAGFSNTSSAGAYVNTFFGYQAGRLVSTGYGNSFFGYQGGVTITTGTYNTAIGVSSMYSTPNNVNNNVAIGNASLGQGTGSDNVCIGAGSGRVAGSSNVYIGYNSGYTTATGSNNIAIGRVSGQYIGDNKLYIAGTPNSYGNLIYGDFATGQLKINDNNTPSLTASAQFEVVSTNRGFLPPRMTNAQRTAISSPAVGLIVYCTDATEGTYEYTSAGWRIVNTGGTVTGTGTTNYLPKWTSSSALGNSQIFDNGTNVGIGTSSPAAKLHVDDGAGAALYIGLGTYNYYRAFEHIWQSINGTFQRMSISSAGNLLVNTSVDSGFNLDVNGTARVSDAVTFGNDINLTRAVSPAIVSTTNQNIRLSTNGFEAVLDNTGRFRNAVGFRTDGFVQAVNLAIGASYYNTTPPTSGAIIQGKVGIGTLSPVASALLDVTSTTQGFLPPRMTSTERGNISSPATGLIVYQTDGTEGLYEKTSSAWRIINGGGGGSVDELQVALLSQVYG